MHGLVESSDFICNVREDRIRELLAFLDDDLVGRLKVGDEDIEFLLCLGVLQVGFKGLLQGSEETL